MKIGILWAGPTSRNLGVQVLARGTEEMVRASISSELSIAFFDFVPTEHGPGLDRYLVLKDARHATFGYVRSLLRDIDLIVDTGAGDSFTDGYGSKRHFLMTYVRGVAASMGIPVVFGPQTIGPFKTRPARAAARWALRKTPLVIARDSVSARLASDLTNQKVVTGTDVVFALPRTEVADDRKFDVMLNVSGLLWTPSNHVRSDVYRDFVYHLIARLLKQGRNVALLPHVLDSENADNDIPAVTAVAAKFGGDVAVEVPDSLDGARQVISNAEVLLGSRMHACLNSLSVGVPAVPLAYSRKFQPLMSDLGWEFTVDMRQQLGPDALVSQVMSSLEAIVDAGPRHLSAARAAASSRINVSAQHLRKELTGP